MKEVLDIRADEAWAQHEFGDTLGQPMSEVRPTGDPDLDEQLQRDFPPLTRRIVLAVSDAMFPEVREKLFKFEPTGSYSAVVVNRKYSRRELADAERLRLLLTRMFEPCGEDMGTEYDDRRACPKCGFGRVQCSPLRLDLTRVPKNVDFAFTIARNEWIVSERLAELMLQRRVNSQDELSGFRLDVVEHCGRRAAPQKWFQLLVTGSAGHTAPPSRFGIDYLRDDHDARFVCAEHGWSGLNLVSEVYVTRNKLEHVDLAVTTNREGLWGGVLMPTPMLVISPRFYRVLREHKIKGYKVEVVHVVD